MSIVTQKQRLTCHNDKWQMRCPELWVNSTGDVCSRRVSKRWLGAHQAQGRDQYSLGHPKSIGGNTTRKKPNPTGKNPKGRFLVKTKIPEWGCRIQEMGGKADYLDQSSIPVQPWESFFPLCALEGTTSLCELTWRNSRESRNLGEKKKKEQYSLEELSIPFNNKIHNRTNSDNNSLWLCHLLKSQVFSHFLAVFAEISKYQLSPHHSELQ